MWRHDRARWQDAGAALRRVGLLPKANVPAVTLSYGERRHLEIARALHAKPELLLMDEPAAGLNSAETSGLVQLLRDLSKDGLSLLIIEHKISFLEELCDRIIVLELGRQIASGTPAEVWANPAVMAAYLGEAK
jgi:ABC-type branched-subunit amino acid transport system ATPase component